MNATSSQWALRYVNMASENSRNPLPPVPQPLLDLTGLQANEDVPRIGRENQCMLMRIDKMKRMEDQRFLNENHPI